MIKFIYFDVGGVVIHDFSGTQKWNELKKAMGVTTENEYLFDDIFKQYEPLVCVGMDIESLLPILTEKPNIRFPDNYSLLHEFVNRFERNESLWPILIELKQKYRIGLLTNMYPGMLEAIYDAHLMPEIEWDVTIDSSVEKLRKPQIGFFKLAQNRSGCNANEILFIDNGEKNTDAARQVGWKTLLYNPNEYLQSNEELKKFFRNVILTP